MDSGPDPTRWVDEWAIDGLTSELRQRIKIELLKAHALLLKIDDSDPYFFVGPMRMAFDRIADILFRSRILTIEILNNKLRSLILDFPAHFGHCTATANLIQDGTELLMAQAAEWRARLLEAEIAHGAAPESESVADQLKRLREKARLTIEELAEAIRLDTRSVERHLAGSATPRIGHIRAYERVFSEMFFGACENVPSSARLK